MSGANKSALLAVSLEGPGTGSLKDTPSQWALLPEESAAKLEGPGAGYVVKLESPVASGFTF